MRDAAEGPQSWSADELAEAALVGHLQAWGELARRHTHRVVLALLTRGVSLDVAEDLAQETWMRLIEQQRAGRLRAIRMPGLAIAQARWLALESSRTQMRREALLGVSALPEPREEPPDLRVASDPETWLFYEERLEIVRRELERCPARARDVFRAVHAEHAPSHAEVARDFGLSVQRVRQILCEVRARLRSAVCEAGFEDRP